MDGELCREAVPEAPSLGRFDVLLLSFEVEKCGLCSLFVGEKYGMIDKKLVCVCAFGKEREGAHECVAKIKKNKKKHRVFVGRSCFFF